MDSLSRAADRLAPEVLSFRAACSRGKRRKRVEEPAVRPDPKQGLAGIRARDKQQATRLRSG